MHLVATMMAIDEIKTVEDFIRVNNVKNKWFRAAWTHEIDLELQGDRRYNHLGLNSADLRTMTPLSQLARLLEIISRLGFEIAMRIMK